MSAVHSEPRPSKRIVDGILLLDKPTGITSNRALQIAKRIYRAKKAGHTGSLDPLASGMLPLCFGQATKVSGRLLDADKEYQLEMFIGQRTDTADADGKVIEQSDKTSITQAELLQAIEQHLGEIQQVPPMYSALKKDGRRLYELAREGIEVERKPRPIHIYQLEIIRFDSARPLLRVLCSKGTYVRSLAETLAEAMGTLAHLTMLRRIMVRPFDGHALVPLAELERLEGNSEALEALLLAPDVALGAYPAVRLTANEAFYLRNGHAVGHAPAGLAGEVRIYDDNDVFLGLGEVQSDGQVAPRRLFVTSADDSK